MKLNDSNKMLAIWKSKRLCSFTQSIWLFPAILTVILIILASLQINGSSMGMYHKIFYGNQPDPALIAGHPQGIRSDEWNVNTQKTIAQSNNDFSTVNNNLGNGEDVSVIGDVPTRDWTAIFKPHNLGFFVLPFDNAFALRWWIMSYFLVLGCYFFILILLPTKRLLASLLSLGFLFSPFFQWWYLSGTLGPAYYCLFGAVVFTKLLHSKKRLQACLWSSLLAYIAVCFTLILYPPFQIPCALVLIAFAIGYLFEQRKNIDKKILSRNLIYLICAIVLALSIISLFIYQKWDIISIIQNTAYPGKRIIVSGGYNYGILHILSSNLSPVFQSITRSNAYFLGVTNQSEASNFIMLFPFLFLPSLYITYKKFKQDKKIDYILLSATGLLIIMLAWIFVPGIDILGKFMLLDKVSPERLLIGLGLINLIFIIGFVRSYSQIKERLSITTCTIYSLLIVIFYLLLDFNVMLRFPEFIDYNYAVIFSLPIAMIVFCFMRKNFIAGTILLLSFSLLSTFYINPLYKGTETLTQTPLSNAIRTVAGTSRQKWASDTIGNLITMNGLPSITGTYLYPQLDIWRQLNQIDKEPMYNRYAHVNFAFDRDSVQYISPVISSLSADQFNIKIEPCDAFMKQNDVGFLITSAIFSPGAAPCASLAQTVSYPSATFYIYKLAF